MEWDVHVTSYTEQAVWMNIYGVHTKCKMTNMHLLVKCHITNIHVYTKSFYSALHQRMGIF